MDRLSREHDVFHWLRGGVPRNYQMFSDFRGGHEEVLDQLLTDLAGVLLKEDVVKLKTVARDGSGYETALEKAPFAGRRP